jgi:hypothetical protein
LQKCEEEPGFSIFYKSRNREAKRKEKEKEVAVVETFTNKIIFPNCKICIFYAILALHYDKVYIF